MGDADDDDGDDGENIVDGSSDASDDENNNVNNVNNKTGLVICCTKMDNRFFSGVGLWTKAARLLCSSHASG
jgi:hypothetical protein